MPEYIEREVIVRKIQDGLNGLNNLDFGFEAIEVLGLIYETPNADVEEVLRCKNCKNYELMKSNNSHFCNEFGGRVTEEDFCSRGARMDGDKE